MSLVNRPIELPWAWEEAKRKQLIRGHSLTLQRGSLRRKENKSAEKKKANFPF